MTGFGFTSSLCELTLKFLFLFFWELNGSNLGSHIFRVLILVTCVKTRGLSFGIFWVLVFPGGGGVWLTNAY